MNFNTKVIQSVDADILTGAVSVPIYQTSTYKQSGIGIHKGYEYSRTKNPTRSAFEKLICDIEEGASGFAFSSGMAAIHTVLMLFYKGDHLIFSDDLYGGTYRYVTQVLENYGIEADFIDLLSYEMIESKIKTNTKGIFFESLSNPLLKVIDVKKIVEIAKKYNILTIVDNTMMTPFHMKPISLGINIVVHSATKYISGHSDVIAGVVVVDSEVLAEKIGFLQNAAGAILGPQDSWLLIRGIKTLGIRMERHQQNAFMIAKYLRSSPVVKKVYYAGVSGMISIEVMDSIIIDKFLEKSKFFILAESLGAVESLVSIPAKMTHVSIPKDRRKILGISDNLVRLSIGIEDVSDLIKDLESTFGR